MRIAVLGELRLVDDAGRMGRLGGRAGDLLRLLVAEHGRPVPVAVIVDVLWGEHPPRSVTANIQTYASRVRAAVGVTGGAALVHSAAAYRLSLPRERCDLLRFADLVARGAGRMDDPHAALGPLEEAVALWRGTPMTAAMRDRSLTADSIAGHLEELRLRAYALLVDAACRAGEPARVLAGLRRLVAEHPRRESAHALLLRALYEAGDSAAAVCAYHEVRRTLSDELGVEPAEHLQVLYRAILRGAPPGQVGSGRTGTEPPDSVRILATSASGYSSRPNGVLR